MALAAFAALRRDTHRALNVLRPEIDSAFVGHRIATSSPEDATDLAMRLVLSQIRAIVDDDDVGRFVGLEAIKRWLEHRSIYGGGQFGKSIEATKPAFTLDQVMQMLRSEEVSVTIAALTRSFRAPRPRRNMCKRCKGRQRRYSALQRRKRTCSIRSSVVWSCYASSTRAQRRHFTWVRSCSHLSKGSSRCASSRCVTAFGQEPSGRFRSCPSPAYSDDSVHPVRRFRTRASEAAQRPTLGALSR
jgi:hypothetical protein